MINRARSHLQRFKLLLPQVGHIDRIDAQQNLQGDEHLRWEASKFGEYKVNWEVCKESCSNVWYMGVLIWNHVRGGDGVTERAQSTCGCLHSCIKVCAGARFS